MSRAFLLITAFVACSRPPPPSGVGSRPDASVDAVPPSSEVITDAAAPHDLRFHFALEARGTTGERTLSFVSNDGAVREIVGTVAPTHRCTSVFDEREHAPLSQQRHLRLRAGCGVDLSVIAQLRDEDRSIVLRWRSGGTSLLEDGATSRSIPLPPGAVAKLDEALADPGAPSCVSADAATPPVVDIRFDGDLLVPALGIAYRFNTNRVSYCHARRSLAASRMQIACGYSESGRIMNVYVRDGALFVDTYFEDYDSFDRAPLGGRVLPCGATVRLPRVHTAHPQRQPVGGCSPCGEAEDLCSDPCWEKMSDEKGELTEKGKACSERCGKISQLCYRACRGH